ncbi:MAG: NAD(P)/FAD-dependent oxidoreductase [Acidimicrobiia bacterium]|nr:NAD(P)/FAD-dependent oxidoreductase [Acidimicrobiia bacterium]
MIMNTHYDAVVVGGRVAGAATAMLLARAGADVLLIERGTPGRDTLSTHALMRGAVVQLDRWGLLDEVAASTPAVTATAFRYPTGDVRFEIEPLYAPRRTVLDPIMANAAARAGAIVVHETSLVGVSRDSDERVCGVTLSGKISGQVSADIVIGADGLHSTVARLVDAPVIRSGSASNATIVAYVEDAPLDPGAYVWGYSSNAVAGVIPTNAGRHCVFVSYPTADFRARAHGSIPQSFRRLLDYVDPATASAVAAGKRVGPLRSTPGHVGQFRQASGAGWALVGDAGYFKDPGAAHGISDAFRDAELLSHAIAAGDLTSYGRQRDALSAELFDVLERIVSFSWTLEGLPELHGELISAMSDELRGFLSVVRDRTAVLAA